MFCDFAEIAGEPVGYAIWFYSYSTFTGRHGIYLEDLLRQTRAPLAGIGKVRSSGTRVALCSESLTRLEWAGGLDRNRRSAFFTEAARCHRNGWLDRLPPCRRCARGARQRKDLRIVHATRHDRTLRTLPRRPRPPANDSTAELGAGGLVYVTTDVVEMRSEDLFISMEEVRVRYEFVNTSDHDVTTLVAPRCPTSRGTSISWSQCPWRIPTTSLGLRPRSMASRSRPGSSSAFPRSASTRRL